MLKRVVIIGSGNLAEQLALAVSEAEGVELVQLYARNPERGKAVAALAHTRWTNNPQELAEADLYLISVSDRAVREVAESLPIPQEAVVAHTAGSVPLDALDRYPRRAIFYPFQGFSVGRRVSFRELYLFLEVADEQVMTPLAEFAHRLSEHVLEADSERRARIHLAGVLCNNFTNCMYTLASEVLQSADLPFDVLKPLIAETAAKAIATDDPRTVQTGPAKRGDRSSQERHLALIDDERLKTIYELISQTIWETSKKI